ncbi:MAG: hypothetical protein ABEJ93_02790 [Candidatus Nanohalobium sp.]
MSYEERLINYSGTAAKNLSELQGNLTFNQTGQVNVSQFANLLGDAAGPTAFGSRPITGLAILAATSVLLYQSQASLDTSAGVMVPLVFVLATFGLLPASQGIIYGIVLGISTLATFAVARFIL